MILYNTLMGVCVGLGLLLVADALRCWATGRTLNHAGTGIALLVVGVPLTVLAGAMTLTWPLTKNPPINIAFGEPSLLLGVLLVAAGTVMLWPTTRLTHPASMTTYLDSIRTVVFALGLILAVTSSAIFSYDLVGNAPSQEPITGQVTGWENTFFGLLYAVAALGCLVFPWAVGERRNLAAANVVSIAWSIAGAAFLLFAVLNYRTHIGLLINLERGTNYRW